MPETKLQGMSDEEKLRIYEMALRRICTAGSLIPGDPLDDAYQEAGGGYGGLQAIAAAALDMTGRRWPWSGQEESRG